jgi:hypothetical protein
MSKFETLRGNHPNPFNPRGALGDNAVERLVGFLIVIPSEQELAKGWDAEHEGSQRLNKLAMSEFETLRDNHPKPIQTTGRSG